MARCDVLVVGGTHGNEVNGAWLVDQWREQPSLLDTAGLSLALEIGNPEARAVSRRYVDRDLNRCFTPDLLNQGEQEVELKRARQLLAVYGPESATPCRVALDLHSTTAAMGNCLVVYGRRPADLALAARVQGALGLPVYLHEADAAQTGFLVEQWPCGLVIEVGPVPQGVLDARVVRQTRIALETCLQQLAAARAGRDRDPHSLVVHRHLGSVDLRVINAIAWLPWFTLSCRDRTGSLCVVEPQRLNCLVERRCPLRRTEERPGRCSSTRRPMPRRESPFR